jgi:hypothetical protein
MTSKQFYALVAEMRATQIRYFRSRGTQLLVHSKELEHDVDAALIELLKSPPEDASVEQV